MTMSFGKDGLKVISKKVVIKESNSRVLSMKCDTCSLRLTGENLRIAETARDSIVVTGKVNSFSIDGNGYVDMNIMCCAY